MRTYVYGIYGDGEPYVLIRLLKIGCCCCYFDGGGMEAIERDTVVEAGSILVNLFYMCAVACTIERYTLINGKVLLLVAMC